MLILTIPGLPLYEYSFWVLCRLSCHCVVTTWHRKPKCQPMLYSDYTIALSDFTQIHGCNYHLTQELSDWFLWPIALLCILGPCIQLLTWHLSWCVWSSWNSACSKQTLTKQVHAFHSSHELLPPNIPYRERVEKPILLQRSLCQWTSTPFACADGSLDITPPSSYPLTSVNHRFMPSDFLGGLLLPGLLELPHTWSFYICPWSSTVHQSFKDPKFLKY